MFADFIEFNDRYGVVMLNRALIFKLIQDGSNIYVSANSSIRSDETLQYHFATPELAKEAYNKIKFGNHTQNT